MQQSSNNATSLEPWLSRTYVRFLQALQALQEHAGKASTSEKGRGSEFINMSPFLSLDIDARFLESATKKYTLDLAGALYRMLDLVIDVPAKRLLAASVIVQDTGKPASVINIDVSSIQDRVAAILGKQASVADLDESALNSLFKLACSMTLPNGKAMPPIDIIKVIDAKLFEQLMAIDEMESPPSSVESMARRLAALLAACRDGLVRFYPIKDKLASFACKVGSAIQGRLLEDIAGMASTFLPSGSAAIVVHTGEAMAMFRVKRSMRGEASIAALSIAGIDGFLPVVPDILDALADKIRRDAGVDVVLFFSLDEIIDIITMTIDGIIAREHDKNGPGLARAISESIGLYARTFKLTWYSRPRAMLTKLFPRFLLRFAKIRLDLPRFLHDRAAMAVVSAFLDNFGKDFSMVACLPVRQHGQRTIKAIEITVKNLVPVRFSSVDPATFAGIRPDMIDASDVARTVHLRLGTTSPVPVLRYVLVIAPKIAETIASAWKTMFRRVAWNPFALLDVLKRCRDPRAFGLHPMPRQIGDMLKSKPKDVVRRLSNAYILKY
ncbi:MAG: hypothetical protein Q6370_020245 [Candidatus Sigynarchaeota archaeon]